MSAGNDPIQRGLGGGEPYCGDVPVGGSEPAGGGVLVGGSEQAGGGVLDCGSEPEMKFASMSVEAVFAMLSAAQTIAISGHINPDGDAVGSALALRDLLLAMGKEVVVLLGQESPAPELYSFLPRYDFVYASEYCGSPDLFIVVDAATVKRLGMSERVLQMARQTLVIDHHESYEGFSPNYFGDTTAPATASLVWRIIKASAIEPSLEMSSYCYVGLMTDTGRFAFKNTDRTAFADAMEMIDSGANPAELSQLVYEKKSLGAMRLEALVIDRVRFSCDGTVAFSYLLKDDLESLGLSRDATEQLPTILRSINGVEVAVLLRDEMSEGVRVNLRSRSSYDVGALARELGGGGHPGAAGATLAMPLDEAISTILGYLDKKPPFCDFARPDSSH